MKQAFEYGGYHFIPQRRFRGKSEKDFFAVSCKLRTDFELGLFSDRRRQGYRTDYCYEDFYAASTDKECDVFRCVETGRLYVPCANELLEFSKTPVRERSKAR